MILYYKRPYIYIPEAHKCAYRSPLNAVDKADCLYRRSLPVSGSYFDRPPGSFSTSVLDQNDYDEKNLRILKNAIYYHFLDIKMCDVDGRKEAFVEINKFLSANNLQLIYTLVKQHNKDLLISIFGDVVHSAGRHQGLLPVVEFILSSDKRASVGYEMRDDGSIVQHSKDILPQHKDKYYKAYAALNAKR